MVSRVPAISRDTAGPWGTLGSLGRAYLDLPTRKREQSDFQGQRNIPEKTKLPLNQENGCDAWFRFGRVYLLSARTTENEQTEVYKIIIIMMCYVNIEQKCFLFASSLCKC